MTSKEFEFTKMKLLFLAFAHAHCISISILRLKCHSPPPFSHQFQAIVGIRLVGKRWIVQLLLSVFIVFYTLRCVCLPAAQLNAQRLVQFDSALYGFIHPVCIWVNGQLSLGLRSTYLLFSLWFCVYIENNNQSNSKSWLKSTARFQHKYNNMSNVHRRGQEIIVNTICMFQASHLRVSCTYVLRLFSEFECAIVGHYHHCHLSTFFCIKSDDYSLFSAALVLIRPVYIHTHSCHT